MNTELFEYSVTTKQILNYEQTNYKFLTIMKIDNHFSKPVQQRPRCFICPKKTLNKFPLKVHNYKLRQKYENLSFYRILVLKLL